MNIDIEFETKGVARLLTEADKTLAPAAARTINRTLSSVRSQSARQVAKAFGTAKKNVDIRVSYPRFARAKPNKLSANVAVFARPVPAHRFGTPRKSATGVTVKGPAGGRWNFPGAFTLQRGNTRLVLGRTGERKRRMKRGRYVGTKIKREPVRIRTVRISPRAEHITGRVFRKLVNERLVAGFDHEMRYRLRLT